MILIMVFSYSFAASVLVPLTTIIRTPEHDTAVVESSRINGNFAYNTVEGHAYKALTPLLGNIIAPDFI